MSIASVLARGRAAALARMLDTCEIRYHDGTYTFNEVTGADEPNMVARFQTPCSVKERGLSVHEVEAGGRVAAKVVRELEIPWNKPAVLAGDVAVMLTIHETTDPTLDGATLRLDGPAPSSQRTKRALQVSEEVS